jgi:hypothetical protein
LEAKLQCPKTLQVLRKLLVKEPTEPQSQARFAAMVMIDLGQRLHRSPVAGKVQWEKEPAT